MRERQTLIELPDVSQMIAELKVHEAEIKKVRVGQIAVVEVDAVADRKFYGRVKRVSPVADSGSRWSNTALKVYKTEIEIQGDDLGLKPSMSASATIIVADLEDVLYVPLHAVRNQGAVRYVWLATASGPEARPVELGLNDFQWVEIKSGLEEGDRVYLAVPPEATEPEFEQPAEATPEIPEVEELSAESSTDDGNVVEATASSEGASTGELMQKLASLLKSKHPELASQVDGNPRAMWMNAEVRQAIQDDDELRAVSQALRDAYMSGGGFGSRGGHGGRPGGEERHDDGD